MWVQEDAPTAVGFLHMDQRCSQLGRAIGPVAQVSPSSWTRVPRAVLGAWH